MVWYAFQVNRCWFHRCLFGETFSWYDLAVSSIELLKHANGPDCVPMVDHHKAYAELYKYSFYLSSANTRGLIEESNYADFFFVKLGSGKGKICGSVRRWKKWCMYACSLLTFGGFNLYNNVMPFSASKYSTCFIFWFNYTEPNFPAHNL